MTEKLQKILANAGYGSRRELETWISAGRVTINGKMARLGDRASSADRILVDGKLARISDPTRETIKVLIYHKPEGQICSRKDEKERPTVFDDLPGIPNGRWVSVGRLDINTSGLLLFTNNGDLANKLMHPSTGLEREYLVRVRGLPSPETITMLTKTGVEIDGRKAHFESVESAGLAEEGTNHWYRVVIKEGRYREVRRMWDAVNHTVSRLKRIRYGSIKLTRDIKRGQHSKMAPMQLEKLILSVGLQDEFKSAMYSEGRRMSNAPSKPKRFDKSEDDRRANGSRNGTRNGTREQDARRGDGRSDTRSNKRSNDRSDSRADSRSDSRPNNRAGGRPSKRPTNKRNTKQFSSTKPNGSKPTGSKPGKRSR